ncbi:hypothetical protein ACVWYV_001899 [Pantoea eucalypti]
MSVQNLSVKFARAPGAHNRDHKESLTKKVQDKASDVKDKVENKLHHDHTH